MNDRQPAIHPRSPLAALFLFTALLVYAGYAGSALLTFGGHDGDIARGRDLGLMGLSADGSTVYFADTTTTGFFSWSARTGIVPAGEWRENRSISKDGKVRIVPSSSPFGTDTIRVEGKDKRLPLDGVNLVSVSGDGRYVYGLQYQDAFRWSVADDSVESFAAHPYAIPTGSSFDGSVVIFSGPGGAGYWDASAGFKPLNQAMRDKGVPIYTGPDSDRGNAVFVSDDASVIASVTPAYAPRMIEGILEYHTTSFWVATLHVPEPSVAISLLCFFLTVIGHKVWRMRPGVPCA